MENKYSIIITTTSNAQDATKIAEVLLKEKLAACIQVSSIKSYYSWKDSINIDEEQQLLIKCKTEDYVKIENCIKNNHTYEIPEIIMLPILKGSSEYLNWIDEVTGK